MKSSHTEATPPSTTPPSATPPSVTPPSVDDEVFGSSLNKPSVAQQPPSAAVTALNKPMWKLRRWTKGKGYETVTKGNETVTEDNEAVTNGNGSHVVNSEAVESTISTNEVRKSVIN